MGRRKVIVHPTDFSPGADAAVSRALDAAKREGAELVFVHVLEPMPALADEAYVARRLEMHEAAGAAARKGFDRLLARAKRAGVPASDVLMDGYPAEEIVKVAEDRRAGLIVMGTHGRTGFKRLLLGSVAARVIATAPCPVLTVRFA